MQVPFADFARAHQALAPRLEAACQTVLASGAYINGPAVADFADALGSFLHVEEVVPCANGTDALWLALKSLDLPLGSKVLVPAFGFASAAEAVVNAGLEPLFYPVGPQSFNLAPEDLETWQLPGDCHALVVVHLFGLMADMERLMPLARKKGLRVIEDNAQSLGAKTPSGKMAGAFADWGTTSFFPTKNLGGFGDGGALWTQDPALAQKARALAKHGTYQKYHYELVGVNSRLDSLQAALLQVKLEALPQELANRRAIAEVYLKALEGSPLHLPVDAGHALHTYNSFTIRAKEREKLRNQLTKAGVGTMVYYPQLQADSPAYRKFSRIGDWGGQSKLCAEVLSLPVFPYLHEKEATYVAKQLGEALQK